MDDNDVNKLLSELNDVGASEEIRLDLDNILNTFGGNYDRLVKSIREQVYYRAATDLNRDKLEESRFVTQLIDELDLPRSDNYLMGLHNSIEFMIDSLIYQGLSPILAQWFIFAAMWDQPPYNYVKFIMDVWSDRWIRAGMLEHDYHDDHIIAFETLLQQEDVFDRYHRGELSRRRDDDYEDEMTELLEWVENNMEYEGTSGYAITLRWRLNFVRQIYSQIRRYATPQLTLSILDALNNKRSIDLFKLVYEFYHD